MGSDRGRRAEGLFDRATSIIIADSFSFFSSNDCRLLPSHSYPGLGALCLVIFTGPVKLIESRVPVNLLAPRYMRDFCNTRLSVTPAYRLRYFSIIKSNFLRLL